MLTVGSSGDIHLTRGDTAWFSVVINNTVSSEEYTLAEDDTLTMTIKKRAKDLEYLIQKTLVGETIFHIEPADTQELAFGAYVYDVQLTTANGDVFTVITPTTFELTSEVTY